MPSKDSNPHPSIQTWSRGDLFPAVISTVETYRPPLSAEDFGADMVPNGRANYEGYLDTLPLSARLISRKHRLTLGAYVQDFDTYDEASGYAGYLLAMRALAEQNERRQAIDAVGVL